MAITPFFQEPPNPMIKRLAIISGLLLLVLVGAMIAAVILIDPNDYRDKISDMARDATGRELHIVDDMQLSVFPWIGVELGVVTLGNAEGFGPEPFARISGARIKVRLIPLFSRRIEVDTVTLTGLEVRLATDADGRNNWDDLTATATTDDEPAVTAPAPSNSQANAQANSEGFALPAALTISGLDIRSAALYWRDDVAGTTLEITGLNLASDRIEADRPVDFRLDFNFRADEPALAGHVDVSTRITARFEDQFFLVEPLSVTARLEGEMLPVSPMDAGFRGNIGIDLRREVLEMPTFSLTVLGLDISGSVQGQEILDEPRLSGKLDIAEFEPRRLLGTLADEAPETTDPDALKTATLGLRFRVDPEQATLDDIALRLDDSRLTGTASARNLDAEVPALTFDLALDQIDVDRYLPPSDEAPVATPATAPAAALELPMETLRALDLTGKLAIDRLKASGLNMTDFRLETRARDGVIAVNPIGAALYGGRYSGNVRLDVRGDVPQISIDEAVTGVRAEPLLQDMLDLDLVSGIADFRIKATVRGTSDEELRRSATGNASFSFRNGAIKGLNTAQMIREGTAMLQGRSAPATESRETDFTELTGSLVIGEGMVRNDDLRGNSPYLRLGGSGHVDIVNEQIDYRLRARIVDTETGQGGAGLDDVKGVDIPIRISGALMEPDIRIDSAFLRNLLRDKLAPQVEELRQEADQRKEQLREEAEGRKEELKQDVEERLEQQLRRLLR